MPTLFHCQTLNRLKSPEACPICDFRGVCKLGHADDKKLGQRAKARVFDIPMILEKLYRGQGRTWESVALEMDYDIGTIHKSVKKWLGVMVGNE